MHWKNRPIKVCLQISIKTLVSVWYKAKGVSRTLLQAERLILDIFSRFFTFNLERLIRLHHLHRLWWSVYYKLEFKFRIGRRHSTGALVAWPCDSDVRLGHRYWHQIFDSLCSRLIQISLSPISLRDNTCGNTRQRLRSWAPLKTLEPDQNTVHVENAERLCLSHLIIDRIKHTFCGL